MPPLDEGQMKSCTDGNLEDFETLCIADAISSPSLGLGTSLIRKTPW